LKNKTFIVTIGTRFVTFLMEGAFSTFIIDSNIIPIKISKREDGRWIKTLNSLFWFNILGKRNGLRYQNGSKTEVRFRSDKDFVTFSIQRFPKINGLKNKSRFYLVRPRSMITNGGKSSNYLFLKGRPTTFYGGNLDP
jgi:hypothetical protein